MASNFNLILLTTLIENLTMLVVCIHADYTSLYVIKFSVITVISHFNRFYFVRKLINIQFYL